jgi:hypothetical protein
VGWDGTGWDQGARKSGCATAELVGFAALSLSALSAVPASPVGQAALSWCRDLHSFQLCGPSTCSSTFSGQTIPRVTAYTASAALLRHTQYQRLTCVVIPTEAGLSNVEANRAARMKAQGRNYINRQRNWVWQRTKTNRHLKTTTHLAFASSRRKKDHKSGRNHYLARLSNYYRKLLALQIPRTRTIKLGPGLALPTVGWAQGRADPPCSTQVQVAADEHQDEVDDAEGGRDAKGPPLARVVYVQAGRLVKGR